MQIVVERLDRPWGLARQAHLLARWWSHGDRELKVVVGDGTDVPEDLEPSVVTASSPPRVIDPDRPTLAGPYPAASWVHRAGVQRYCLLLTHLPWGLYPSRQQRWLGRLPVYYRGNRDLLWRSLRHLMFLPVRRLRAAWNRRRDRRAVKEADRVFLLDGRLKDPVEDLYGREGELVLPIVPAGHEGVRDPNHYFLAAAPLEPIHNLRRIVDAFYLFVNRLGVRHRPDWEKAQPLRMWKPGDVQLRVYGRGSGKGYLRDYADAQQLGDRVTFEPWPAPSELDRVVRKALAVVDVPLGGGGSTLPYQALSEGVPAVYTQYHDRLEDALGENPLAHHVGGTDTAGIGEALLSASRVPASRRTPPDALREQLDPDAASRVLLDAITSPA